MLAPEVVERNPRITTADAAVGTGPFILQSTDDTAAVLVRNPDYWKPGMPYLDGIRLAYIRDQQARWQAFLAGQMDVAPVPGTESKKFLAEQSKNYFTGWFKDAAIQNVWMNTQRKPFDDARVVKALRLLIDHSEFITGWADVWWGPGLPNVLVSHFPHTMDAWDFTQDEYKAMLEWKQPKDEAAREALRLLNAAGISRDNPLKFTIRNNDSQPSGQTMAQLLQAQYTRLSQGAVQTELGLTDNTTLSTTLARGDFDVAGPSARGSYFDPEEVLRNIYHSKGGRNFGKYADAALDDMIDKQRSTFDVAQRRPLVKFILQYLTDRAPYVGPCSRDQLTAAQAKVQNLAPIFFTGVYAFQFEQVWLDV
jgi:peptide/nickel transport system substrate-binding protein